MILRGFLFAFERLGLCHGMQYHGYFDLAYPWMINGFVRPSYGIRQVIVIVTLYLCIQHLEYSDDIDH